MSTLSSNKSCYGVSGKIWGKTQTVFIDDNSEVAVAHIQVGGFCSLHTHARKWNRFYVISGKLEVILDKGHCEDKITLTPGMTTDVPPGIPHRFNCIEECVCLEIYWIDPLDANDIQRKDNGGMDLAERRANESKAHSHTIITPGGNGHITAENADRIFTDIGNRAGMKDMGGLGIEG
jgi:mannose-6-phosphate isomerase-like protein (cupin superfamily)